MHILANFHQSTTLQKIFEIHWGLLPNLAMDIIVPPLSKIISLEDAGKIFISVIVLMWIIGPLTLHRALFGCMSFWPLAASFFAYNWCLSYGTLNFVFGAGLSFFVLAAWVNSSHWPSVWRLIVFTLLAIVLFFSHLVAFGIYVLAVLGFETSRTFQTSAFSRPRQALWQWYIALGQFAIPLIIFVFLSPTSDTVITNDAMIWGSLKERLNAARSPVLFEWGPIDYLTLVVTAMIFLYAMATRSLKAHPVFLGTIVILLLVAVLMPAGSDGEGLRHIRVPPVLAALLFAGTSWAGKPGRKIGTVIFALCAILFLTRIAITADRWQQYDERIIEFRHAILQIEEGSSLFSVLSTKKQSDYWRTNANSPFPYLHVVDYAVILRSAFTPSLFARPGAQPIQRAGTYATIDVKLGPFMTWDRLAELAEGNGSTGLRNFDYVAVLNLDQKELVPFDFLTSIYSGSYFTIFKIDIS